MRRSFWLRTGLILGGIVVCVGIACALGGWTAVAEIGLAFIFGGVAAIFLGTLLGPTGPTRRGPAGSGNPYLEDLARRVEEEDIRRIAKMPGSLLFAWLAAGALAILVGVLLRVLG